MKNPAVRGRGRDAGRSGRWSQPLDICSDPAFATHLNPLAQPVVVSKFWKNRRRNESVHVSLSEYEGQPLINVRIYSTGTDGIDRPRPRGVAMGIRKLA
jgi:hypothetical protein